MSFRVSSSQVSDRLILWPTKSCRAELLVLLSVLVLFVGLPWLGYVALQSRLGFVVGGMGAAGLAWSFRRWVTALSVEVGQGGLVVMSRWGPGRGAEAVLLRDISAVWDGWEEKRVNDDGSWSLFVVSGSGEMFRIGPWGPAFLADPGTEARWVRDWLARVVAERTGQVVKCAGRSPACSVGPSVG